MNSVRTHQNNTSSENNRKDTQQPVKNHKANLNATNNHQDNPNAVRKQLTGLLWYYRQNCLICHLAKLPHLNRRPHYHFAKLSHLNRGPTLNHYNLAKLPHLNRGPQLSHYNLAKLPHLNRRPHFSHHYLAKHPQHYFRHKRRLQSQQSAHLEVISSQESITSRVQNQLLLSQMTELFDE